MTKQSSSTAVPFLRPHFLSPHLDVFVTELRATGYASLTIRGYSDSIAHFGTWAFIEGFDIGDVGGGVLTAFAQHRCQCPGGRRHKHLSRRYVNRVRRFVDYLSEQGVLRQGVPVDTQPKISMLDAFCHWLHTHRGLSPRTVALHERAIIKLSPLLGNDTMRYTAVAIRRAVHSYAKQCSTAEAKHIGTGLRAYLRFLAAQGECPPGLDAAVPTVAQWRLSSLPRYVSAEDVERIIHSCDVDTARGRRDRAILLLLARLGLRAGDIVAMRLSDIDWEQGTVQVRGKGRRAVALPLPQDAGEALLTYLEHARPVLPIEQVFLCLQAPHRPLGRSNNVSAVVQAAVIRAGISNPPSTGANLLRHSAATTMLRAGMTLDAVSSVLRHRSTDTTAHYAKVDVGMLETLVQPWPEGAPC